MVISADIEFLGNLLIISPTTTSVEPAFGLFDQAAILTLFQGVHEEVSRLTFSHVLAALLLIKVFLLL